MKSKTVFTKRGLIVVIGIAIFLLANLAAVGARGRQRAKEAVCLSNLRKWGSVFQMYAQDNDGFFMEGRNFNPWWLALEPYYKNRRLLCCPMAKNPDLPAWPNTYHSGNFGTWPRQWFPDPKGGPNFYGSYGINEWVCNPTEVYGIDPAEFQNFWRTPNVAGADRIPLLLDSWWDQGWAHYYDWIPDWPGQWQSTGANDMAHFCLIRHSGAINGVFLDGSAKRVELKCLWNLNWHRGYPVDEPPPDWPDWIEELPECDL